jgi:hypothetical protein
MATEEKIDFGKVSDGKIAYISSDTPKYEWFVDEWEANHDEDEPEPVPAEGSDEFWDWAADYSQREWDDFRSNFKYSALAGKLCLVHGYFGGWLGKQAGGKVMRLDSAEDLLACIANHADHVDVWVDKDGLHITNAHHDGTDHYDVDILTEAGETWWRDEGEEGQDRETHAHLLETEGLTRKVDFYII